MKCPLCAHTDVYLLLADHWHCTACDLRFKDRKLFLNRAQEHERYKTHNNDMNDDGYRKFLQPMQELVGEYFSPGASGLDYGVGPGPLLAKLLRDDGYDIEIFDPFFSPAPAPLEKRYDFIVMTEVAEHFHQPDLEFRRLREMLNPGGALAIMTAMFEPHLDFSSWYYRRDPTHVMFYSRQTFAWIAREYHLQRPVFKSDRLILLLT